MIKILWTALMIFFLSCNSREDKKITNTTKKDSLNIENTVEHNDTVLPNKLGFYTIEGDSLVVPPFEIDISLSNKARERITSKNETLVVDVFLNGTPKDPSKAEFEEDGSFFVGSSQKEISYGQIAKFDNLKFPRKIYDQLVDKDADFNINVYTGRKSSPDNLIDCEFLSGKLSSLINQRKRLVGKLIFGDN